MTQNRDVITGGNNIALKVPSYCYDQTLSFYRDTLGLRFVREELGSPGFEFGSDTLWIDHVPRYPKSDVWLQVFADEIDGAAELMRSHGVPLREEVEPYDDVLGFWISDPSGTIIRLSPA